MLCTAVMSGVYRYQVLSLYKQILRLGRSWTSASGRLEETEEERSYITTEARRLFRNNKDVTSDEKIKEYLREAETRIGLTEHYGTPYPRMMNFPQKVLPPKGQIKLKTDQKIMNQATPIYLKSLKDETQDNR